MRFSKTFVKTLREAPKDETAKNGAFLVRAGYIHKEIAGVYDFLPLGLRVIEKIKGKKRGDLVIKKWIFGLRRSYLLAEF